MQRISSLPRRVRIGLKRIVILLGQNATWLARSSRSDDLQKALEAL
jgi:hypothetical protein